MELDKIQKVEKSLENLNNKSARIYFLVQDTKGNPKAGIKYIYDMALTLKNNGFNSIIIHETKDYNGVADWLGEEYMSLPHQPIENQNLAISPEDFIVIPEIYAHVMEQLKNFPCGKIVLCQAYDQILETLPPGITWANYGFIKCITTSETQKKYISEIMKNVNIDMVEPFISEHFTKKEKPSKPIISIHTREPRDTAKIIKTFYLKYPQYRWITFRDMRGIKQEDFSKFLKDSYVSVWVDNESAFGTYPLECMITGTPVIGKVPNLKPEWMNEENGFWVNNKTQIVDFIADILQNWLEDSLDDKLFESMSETVKSLPTKEEFYNNSVKLFDEYITTRLSSFENQLSKLQTIEE